MIALDTNVISEMMQPAPDPSVMDWLRGQPSHTLAITTISLAEIRYGISRLPEGQKRRSLEMRFQSFITMGFGDRIMAFDTAAANAYGDIVAAREKTGKPIETFDAMIASIARCRGARIATRDTNGFADCGVDLINPWEHE